MNEALGRIHFWLNVFGFLLLLALPIYFNLAFHAPANGSKVDKFFSAFGASMGATVLGVETMAVTQIFFQVNVLWSAFKGERISHPASA